MFSLELRINVIQTPAFLHAIRSGPNKDANIVDTVLSVVRFQYFVKLRSVFAEKAAEWMSEGGVISINAVSIYTCIYERDCEIEIFTNGDPVEMDNAKRMLQYIPAMLPSFVRLTVQYLDFNDVGDLQNYWLLLPCQKLQNLEWKSVGYGI